jgi:NhaP-type Na+/H+ or K+/H+ antiporter
MSTGLFAVMAAAVLAWYLVSARAEKADISAAMAMVVVGLVLTRGPLAVVDVNIGSSDLSAIAEATLAVLLFTDASRVSVTRLRADAGLPVRLLAIGLPLTILAGAGAAAVLVGGLGVWVACAVGAIVAPTDAALGAPILVDERIPSRIRRVLNVESGLNDGIATPFVNMFLAAAISGGLGNASSLGEGAGTVAWEILGGVAWGAGAGLAGAWLIRTARRRGWSSPGVPAPATLAVVVLVYAGALSMHANGFVAAFVAGLAFGSLTDEAEEQSLTLTEDVGQVLSLVVWFLFGAAMVVPALQRAEWSDLAFAVVALTVVRMVPVALSCLGAGLDRSTVALIGWFGPRGLATVVFTLIAYDALETAEADRVLAVGAITVLLSVVAHGVTAAPFARRYAEHLARRPSPVADLPEGRATGAAPRARWLGRRRPAQP